MASDGPTLTQKPRPHNRELGEAKDGPSPVVLPRLGPSRGPHLRDSRQSFTSLGLSFLIVKQRF